MGKCCSEYYKWKFLYFTGSEKKWSICWCHWKDECPNSNQCKIFINKSLMLCMLAPSIVSELFLNLMVSFIDQETFCDKHVTDCGLILKCDTIIFIRGL